MSRLARRMPRLPLWVVGVVIVSSVVALAAHRSGDDDWAEATRRDLVIGVELNGTLKAAASEILGPPVIPDVWDYRIASLAKEGAKVSSGQPVLGFDTSTLRQNLEQVRAEHDQAAKELEKRQVELALARQDDELKLAEAQATGRKARLKAARPEELVSSKELAEARLDLELAEKEVAALTHRMEMSRKAAEAELTALRDSERRAAVRVAAIEAGIARMNVVAPRAGTVVYVTNWRDEKKKVGDTCWRMEKVIEIPDLTTLEVAGEVDEADAGKVAAGQRAVFRLDALPDSELGGTVREVSRALERKTGQGNLRVVHVRIALDQVDVERMRPGMRLRGTIEVSRLGNVLVVPAETVFPLASGPVVYRRTALGIAATPVTLGEHNGALVEIRAGLAAGDRVARRAPAGGST